MTLDDTSFPSPLEGVTPWRTSDGVIHLSKTSAIEHETALNSLIGFLIYVKRDHSSLMSLHGMVVVNAADKHKMIAEHFMSDHFGQRVKYTGTNMSSMNLTEMWYINHQAIHYKDFGSTRWFAKLEDADAPFALWGAGHHIVKDVI